MPHDRPHARAMLAGHELRNDLEGARRLAEAAGEQVAAGVDPGRTLRTLTGVIERAQHTVAGLLLAPQLEPRRTPCRLDTVLERVVDTHDPDRERVTLTASSLLAHVDELMVERISDNLVANALEHTPPGATVHVDAALEDGGVRITVADDGPGLPDEAAARLEGDPDALDAEDAAAEATGLTLVTRFAHAHGGRVELGHGPGARVHVLLPSGAPD